MRDVAFGFPLFFAMLIEIVSAFGPITVMRFAELHVASPTKSDHGRAERAMSRRDLPRPAALLLPPERGNEHVALWMSERVMPNPEGEAIPLRDLYDDYCVWCRVHDLTPSTMLAFGAEFDRLRDIPELNGKIRKFGNRYYGIALMRDGPLVPSHRGAAGFERT